MREILIFAGTTEGRKLSEVLCDSGIHHRICVATEYGEILLKHHPCRKIHRGRMEPEEMRDFIVKGSFAAVVDGTHPYAEIVTKNIQAAVEGTGIPYMRLLRQNDTEGEDINRKYFESASLCAKALEQVEGNILLTTGTKDLEKFCSSDGVKKRLYVRILPGAESLSLCTSQGIEGKQIIAMQGPFSEEMNLALIRQFQIGCLVTKESGNAGGYREKLEAAKKAGIEVFVIKRKEEEGYSFAQICDQLEQICHTKICRKGPMDIVLAGIGMGNARSMTLEVYEAIKGADILLGAERMIAPYSPHIEKRPYYLAKQIIPYLKEIQEKNVFFEERKVVILFSGDSGFYSGCKDVFQALEKEIRMKNIQGSVRILPGISSVACLASRIGESYEDAGVFSIHGKDVYNLAEKIRCREKTFLLMSGVKDVHKLGTLLLESGLSRCEVSVGYQLSYEEEKIIRLTPEECPELDGEGLYTCFIKNPEVSPKRFTHGKADGDFIRGKVPMTKEEVRDVSICKLGLYKGAVVYDIGSGTGSIAMEIAGLSDNIFVYAIERKPEAISLIKSNKEKFHLQNIQLVEAEAPEKMDELLPATHAFIGGSGGHLKEILSELYNINPNMRIVINAISLETIAEIKNCLENFKIREEEMIQMQVSRSKKAGGYHLMRAENPVWICSFRFFEE